MRKYPVILICILFISIFHPAGAISSIRLSDWAFNVSGTLYQHDVSGVTNDFSILPPYFDYSGFDQSTGLGNIVVTYTPGPDGDYYFIGFFDHDISIFDNGWTNEYGNTQGIPTPGQSWEIDEPGWVFGDIYDHVLAGALDNSNSIPPGSPEDVSMAMGWNFHLVMNQSAVLTLHVTQDPSAIPPNVLYLQQVDPDSNEMIYLFSNSEEGSKYALNVKKEGNGTGVVSGLGIDCGANCSAVYGEGTQVTLQAKADDGTKFKGWSGGGCGGTGDCVVTMGSDVTVTAEFALNVSVPALGTRGMIFFGLLLLASAVVVMKKKGHEMKSWTLVLLGLVLVLGVAANGWCAGQEQTIPAKQSVPVLKCELRFESLDANHDGVLTYEEFVGSRGPSAQAQEIFSSRDTNGDGVLTVDEFCSGRGPGKTQAPK
jgi:hypothetical protein